ncbi:hypothetical protein KDA00_03725 [Candidatus Saccharibacteria bacterium]|nr:hypothetical protein [Candidatus Saccharibacteria bacterium]
MSKGIISDEFVRDSFAEIASDLTLRHDFPELQRPTLDIVVNGRFENDDVFPMRQVNSRNMRFEFSHGRYSRFASEFEGWLTHEPVSSRGLLQTSLFLFIGSGLVRPIVEDDQMIRFGRQGPRHIKVISNFYNNKKAIEDSFEEIVGNNPEGHKTIVEEITDERIGQINAMRVYLSYLYAAYPDNPDKKSLFGELLRDSRNAIKGVVNLERPTFIDVGRFFIKEDSQSDVTEEAIIFASDDTEPNKRVVQVANRLCSSVLPSWLIALATPVTKESFGHLGSDIWDDRFFIEPTDISQGIVGLNDEFVTEDVQSPSSSGMPSHYGISSQY